MTEKFRTREQINQDYTNHAAQLGNSWFQLELLDLRKVEIEKKIVELKRKLHEINLEPSLTGDGESA